MVERGEDEAAASSGDRTATHCPGCRRSLVRTDALHNRIEGQCRYPHDSTIVYRCPGCAARQPRHHPSHNGIIGDMREVGPKHLESTGCRWEIASTRQGGLHSAGTHARGPRVREHASSSSRLRPVPELREPGAEEHPFAPDLDERAA
eukprot:6035490-Amphidinium_carterae.1